MLVAYTQSMVWNDIWRRRATRDWVNAIKKIIENPSLRNNIIINARNTVEKNYSVESNKDKYLAVFKDLLKKDKIDYKN